MNSNDSLIEDLQSEQFDPLLRSSGSIQQHNDELLTSIEGSGIEGDFLKPSRFPFENTSNSSLDDLLTTEKPQVVNLDKVMRFIDANSWIIYTAIGILTLLVIAFVILIIFCIFKNKQRVIRQRDDPILTSTYEESPSWFIRKLCCIPKKEDGMGARQNSASNLDPYRRQPIIHNSNVSHRINFMDPDNSKYDKYNATNINGIRGINQYPLRADLYRQLPDPPTSQTDLSSAS